MDENRAGILQDSNKIISKLQLLSAYFGEDIIYRIYLRTQIIHQLFEKSDELDINKLELFHLQFTATMIELLQKIKKANERNVSLLYEEIELNNQLITQIKDVHFTREAFEAGKQKQSLKINNSLRHLYQTLSDGTSDYPFAKNINFFSARFAADFFLNIDADLLARLTQYTVGEVYTHAHAIIQRKLMGLLCKHDFRTVFYCGLKSGTVVVEVYRFLDVDRYFVYYPSRSLFLLCDEAEVQAIGKARPEAGDQTIVEELQNKNDHLQASIQAIKTSMPNDIRVLLGEHYKKISDINFLQNLNAFDAQSNILKTMLNTDII